MPWKNKNLPITRPLEQSSENLRVSQKFKKFPAILWNPKLHYNSISLVHNSISLVHNSFSLVQNSISLVHNSISLVPILSQINPAHSPSLFLRFLLISSSYPRLHPPSGVSPSLTQVSLPKPYKHHYSPSCIPRARAKSLFLI